MFKLQPKPSFKARINLSVAGEVKSPEVTIEFKYFTKPAVKDFFEQVAGKTDAEALAEIIVGWSGIDQPYSTENLAMLVDNYPAAATDLFEAFRVELLEAKRKN